MHIIYYGNFTEPWSTESYVARALERAGVVVTRMQECESQQLHYALLAADPADAFLFAKGRVSGEWAGDSGPRILKSFPDIRSRCKKVVCWVWDLLHPEYNSSRFEWASMVSAECDLFCTSDGSTAPLLFNCKVLRQGVGDDVRPGKFREDLACDVLYLGSVYGEREKQFQELQQHFHRRLWHIGSGYRGDILNDVMCSAKIVVGPNWPCFPGYFSNRVYVVAGYGGDFICHKDCSTQPELTAGIYSSAADLDRKISEARAGMLGCGLFQQQALAHHRYDQRVEELLTWLL